MTIRVFNMIMNFNDYQKQAAAFNVIKDPKHQPISYTLGLAGESGEVAEIVKKAIRNFDGDFSRVSHDDLKKELGDVLWYIAMLAGTFDITLDDVATANLQKLTDRKGRDAIKGVGENR
jgi:NTP pyrophosphatase (non-canonical NTP hydrolase)